MSTHDPGLTLVAAFAQAFGLDLQEPAYDREADLLTARYGADAHMARARISGSIEIAGELVELHRGRSALAIDHPAVVEHPHLFFIPRIEKEPEPPLLASGPVCWTDGLRDRPHWTLGRRHGDRRRHG